MWISQEDENQGRPQDPEPPSPHRPQTLVRVNKRFPKTARILHRSHFINLIKQSQRFLGNDVRVEYRRQFRQSRESRPSSPKLGITVSRRYGKSHDRNRFKRVVREAFRELSSSMPADLELHISPKKNHPGLNVASVLIDLKDLLNKIL